MRRPLFLLPLALLTALGAAQGVQPWIHDEFASKQIEAYRKHYDVPGMSIAVAVKGRIVFVKGFGFGNLERQVPVRTTDYFRLASVSKPITATMIFELVEQGKLSLDWPVRQVLPELPAHHVYKIRDLLSHQSGVRHYALEPALRNYSTAVSALDRFAKDPLLFAPGEKFSYSTHAFTILGAVIEKVTKKPYRTYAADRMRAWGVPGVQCETGTNANRTAIYDQTQDKKIKLISRDDLSWKYPGGGYEATAVGMCQLGLSIAQGKILKKETLEHMWTVQKPRTGESAMALGWTISNDGGHKAAIHGGSQPGSNSNWRIQIGEDTVVVVLSNRDGHRPGELAAYLSRLTYLGPNDPRPEIKLPPQ
jgi:serine beta-lactamase-like protein LACTB, mitochondrial